MTSLFFELIQLSIGVRDKLSHEASLHEWRLMYEEAKKQALVGICFAGIERLPKEQQPPRNLLLQWFAMAESIKQRNRLLNARANELTERFARGGFRSCVLKGQGVAELYIIRNEKFEFRNDSLGMLRQSGDIDIWVDGEREDTIRFMREHFCCGRVVFHHMDVEVFDDVAVEVHFVPSFAYSWPRYRVYRRFFEEYKEECFVPSEIGFCVPSLRFNIVYLLIHIFRHVFHDGVGLRQLMDYYFVLRNLDLNLDLNVDRWLRELGLLRFARAVMYVEREVFGLQEEYMICKPDEKAGRFLLGEIMRAGNFGQYDPRIHDAHSGGLVKLYLKNVWRLFAMVRYYPSEVLWAPIWKIWHYVWRNAISPLVFSRG